VLGHDPLVALAVLGAVRGVFRADPQRDELVPQRGLVPGAEVGGALKQDLLGRIPDRVLLAGRLGLAGGELVTGDARQPQRIGEQVLPREADGLMSSESRTVGRATLSVSQS
jgi:hypothetical protein